METVLISLLTAGAVLVGYNTAWKWFWPPLQCFVTSHDHRQTGDTFFDLPVHRCGRCGARWVVLVVEDKGYRGHYYDGQTLLFLDPSHDTTTHYNTTTYHKRGGE